MTSMIERCPRSMMIRELIKNAMEAAMSADLATIDVRAVYVDGVRKLSILNSGRGMTGEELVRMCDIASSIGKLNGLDQNFGMGAKVATLPSNRYGIRYRSNRDGRVHQVIMGKRGDLYGRIMQVDSDNLSVDVVDVTPSALIDGHDLTSDWTEVVLLGDDPHQDTLRDPYNGNPVVSANWIIEGIYQRFFTFPPRVALRFNGDCTPSGSPVILKPIKARKAEFENYEAVQAVDGVIIHYVFDEGVQRRRDGSEEDMPLRPDPFTASIIYQGEIYDTVPSWEWRHDAPRFGISFGSKMLSVLIELPDHYPVRPDGYRQMLHNAENLQQRVSPRDFSTLVSKHRPEWLLELQKRWGPDRRSLRLHRDEMEDLFRSLRVPRRSLAAAPELQTANGGGGVGEHPDPPLSESDDDYEVAPEIISLTDPVDIEDRGLSGKAARFYPEAHQIFINELYGAFSELRQFLESLSVGNDLSDRVRRLSHEIGSKYVTRAICRKVAFGISKRGLWPDWEIDQALSSSSLSLAADDTLYLRAEAAAEMLASLSEAKTQSEPSQAGSLNRPNPNPIDRSDQFDGTTGPRIILPKYMQVTSAAAHG